MKHIKLFENFQGDLLEFVQDNLAYLIDDGFKIEVIDEIRYGGFNFGINIVRMHTWDEIRDRFIPFIHILNKEYRIREIVFMQMYGKAYQFDSSADIKDLLDENLATTFTNRSFSWIKIVVSRVKR
jgi:hypothetical protein